MADGPAAYSLRIRPHPAASQQDLPSVPIQNFYREQSDSEPEPWVQQQPVVPVDLRIISPLRLMSDHKQSLRNRWNQCLQLCMWTLV